MVDTAAHDISRYYANPVLTHPTYSLYAAADSPSECISHTHLLSTHDSWCIAQLNQLLRDVIQHYTTHNTDKSIYTGALAVPVLQYAAYKAGVNDSYDCAKFNDALISSSSSHTASAVPTLLLGDCATLCTAIICNSINNTPYSDLLQQLIAIHQYAVNTEASEVLYGKAGYVHKLLYVLNNAVLTEHEQQLIKTAVNTVLDAIIEDGRTTEHETQSPLMWSWHNKEYLGAAHGVSGILLTILRCPWYLTVQRTTDEVKQSIDFCMSQCYPSGNFKSNFSSNSDRLVQWCHGAVGLALLCMQAYKHYKEDVYLEKAIQQSQIIWERGLLRKGVGLCHGISSNAIVFLHLYTITGNAVHLRRAEYFIDFALNSQHSEQLFRAPNHPYSMFEGVGGAVLALCDLIGARQQKLAYKLQAAQFGV